jgi:hypothetical protein
MGNAEYLAADMSAANANIAQHLVEEGFADDIGGEPSPFDRRFVHE